MQLDLFGRSTKRRRLETAMDMLSERFGAQVVRRAEDLAQPQRIDISVNLDFLDEEDDDE